ncbi:MAG: dihydrolipoamide acetyltransferase family protein [Acidithiobacillus sp.]
MKDPVTMPVLSDTMETGRLVRWNKAVGDPVRKGEAIAEVETDKAILDVEAFADGYLAGPLAPVDVDIPVRQTIAYIVDTPAAAQLGEDAQSAVQSSPAVTTSDTVDPVQTDAVSSAAQKTKSSKAKQTTTSHPAEHGTIPKTGTAAAQGQNTEAASEAAPPGADAAPKPSQQDEGPAGEAMLVSPYARALAADLGVDVRSLRPGADGRVHAAEVLAAAMAGPEPDLRYGPPYRVERLRPMRAAVARNMAATLDTPTFQIGSRLPLGTLHQQAKDRKVSLTLALARACALTVAEDPWFNHAWTRAGLARRERVDIGIAVDTGDGLVTPVLRDAARRPLKELAEDWRILLGKTRKGRLAPEDYEGATFYLSNLGVFPHVTHFNAIVPTGASAILAVAASDAEGRTDFTLSCDHRVIFGADAARFLGRLAERLEHCQWLED